MTCRPKVCYGIVLFLFIWFGNLSFLQYIALVFTDRCHRIGQTRKVTIYKLVTKDTVDADIYEMQERKAKMNAAIMESNESNNKKERKVMLEALVNRFLTGPNNKSMLDDNNDKGPSSSIGKPNSKKKTNSIASERQLQKETCVL